MQHGGIFGSPFWGEHAGGEVEGGQTEFVRVPQADGTLVVIPESLASAEHDAAVLPLGDVFSTGYHGVVKTGVKPGDAVVVLGDGAVGCARCRRPRSSAPARSCSWATTRTARDRHRERRHPHGQRQGAGPARGGQGPDGGRGADAVIETISSNASLGRALETVRDGGDVSVLGMSHYFQPVDQPILAGVHAQREPPPGRLPVAGLHPAAADVSLEDGVINPGVVFTHDLPLDGGPEGLRDHGLARGGVDQGGPHPVTQEAEPQ